MYDYETEDIENLLYHLIDKPRTKAQEEYYKANGYPADSLDVRKPVTDPDILEKLKNALNNLSVVVPVLEIKRNGAVSEGNKVYIFEHGCCKRISPPSGLYFIIQKGYEAGKYSEITEKYAGTDTVENNSKGDIFSVYIPLVEVLKIAATD